MFGKKVWAVEMRSVGKLQELPPSDVTTRELPTYISEVSVILGRCRRFPPITTDVIGGTSFLAELRNLKQLFSEGGADFR